MKLDISMIAIITWLYSSTVLGKWNETKSQQLILLSLIVNSLFTFISSFPLLHFCSSLTNSFCAFRNAHTENYSLSFDS
jgi:Mn2+/Fe2+ NRAMP family transporter